MKDQGPQYTRYRIIVKNNRRLRSWRPEAPAEPGHCQQSAAFLIETQIGGAERKSGSFLRPLLPLEASNLRFASWWNNLPWSAPVITSRESAGWRWGNRSLTQRDASAPFLPLPAFLLLPHSLGLRLPSPCHLGAVLFFSYNRFPFETSLLGM